MARPQPQAGYGPEVELGQGYGPEVDMGRDYQKEAGALRDEMARLQVCATPSDRLWGTPGCIESCTAVDSVHGSDAARRGGAGAGMRGLPARGAS